MTRTVDYFYCVLIDLAELRTLARRLDERFGRALVFWAGPESGVMDFRQGLFIVPRKDDLPIAEQGEGIRKHLVDQLGETVGDRLRVVTHGDEYMWWNAFARSVSEPAPAPAVAPERIIYTEEARLHALNARFLARNA